jgi:hypothetical protein
MYQSYPTSGQPPEPPRMQQPQTIQNAVKLMYAGAALSAVGLILNLVTIGSLKSAIRSADPNFTTSQVNSAETVAIAGAIVGGLIAIGLWLWMASANGKGKSWARIVATVLFAINTLDLVASVARPHAVLALIFSVLIWLVGLGATVLIWNRESSSFYNQQLA